MDVTACDANNTDTEASPSFSNLESFENAAMKKNLYEKLNFDKFHHLKSNVITKLNKFNETDAKEFAKVRSEYQKLPPLNSYLENKAHREEENKLVKQEEKLKEQLKSAIERNETISREIANLREEKEIKEYALRKAKTFYENIWGMEVALKNSTKYVLTYVVKFKSAEYYPMEITLDRKNYSVLDFKGDLFTEEEMTNLKMELGDNRFELPRFMLKIRSQLLGKIQEL